MGEVYIVFDHDTSWPHAVKTFRNEIFSRNRNIAARFIHEASTWINLDAHPNIVKASAVENVAGKPLLFLEYVHGGDLGGWIGTPRLTGNLRQV